MDPTRAGLVPVAERPPRRGFVEIDVVDVGVVGLRGGRFEVGCIWDVPCETESRRPFAEISVVSTRPCRVPVRSSSALIVRPRSCSPAPWIVSAAPRVLEPAPVRSVEIGVSELETCIVLC